ncbi:MAG: VCBS repeat-containing protein [Candidatus Hydrogenedentes bacterium]|nr:VCBS repeat-containing protein [Candidatus Hydrogenedentota bacterium]
MNIRSCRAVLPLLLGVLCAMPGVRAAEKARRQFSPQPRTVAAGPNPCAIACRDLNDDGIPDIVTADRGVLADPRDERPANDELSVFIADQPFSYTRQTPTLKCGFGPYAVALANVDGLKWPDIIVASFHAVRHRDITVFLNIKPEGVFKPVTFKIAEENLPYERHRDGEGVPLFTKPGLTSVHVQDMDGDGLRDLLATGWSSDVVVLMHGHAETYFAEPQFLPVPGGPSSLCVADFNGDGTLDFAVTCQAADQTAVWLGDGRGGFSESSRFPSRGTHPSVIREADMNGDGIPDLAVGHSYTEDSIVLFFGDGKGTFAASQEILLGDDRRVLEKEIRDVIVDDFNGDGRMDLAAACFASGEVAVLLNASADTTIPLVFAREIYPFQDGKPCALASADLDGDEKKDIAAALWEINAVGFLANAGK